MKGLEKLIGALLFAVCLGLGLAAETWPGTIALIAIGFTMMSVWIAA